MDKSSEAPEPIGKGLDRRELLKVLGAAGTGLAAAAFLPGKWLKPVIESGVLPAHAQATCCLTIFDLTGTLTGENNGCHGEGRVYYTDCSGGIEQGNFSLHLSFEGIGQVTLNVNMVGNGFAGYLEFSFDFPGPCQQIETLPFQMWLTVGRCISNTLTQQDIPPGVNPH